MWGQKSVQVAWGEMDRVWHVLPLPPACFSCHLASLGGLGLWGLGREVFLGLSELSTCCPGWGLVRGFIPHMVFTRLTDGA